MSILFIIHDLMAMLTKSLLLSIIIFYHRKIVFVKGLKDNCGANVRLAGVETCVKDALMEDHFHF